MGLQWRQADVSIRIRHCVFLDGGVALSVSACFYIWLWSWDQYSVIRTVRRDPSYGRSPVRMVMRGVINGKHYLTNWSCFQEGAFLTSLCSEKRRIINRNFPMSSIRLLPPLTTKMSFGRFTHSHICQHLISKSFTWNLPALSFFTYVLQAI